MGIVNYQGWVDNMNAWLNQPGQKTQDNVNTIRQQAKAIGVDPAEIDGSGTHVSTSSKGHMGMDSGDIYDAHEVSKPHETAGADNLPLYKKPPVASFNSTEDGVSPGPANGKYDQLIDEAAKKYHLPAALIKSVIQQESGGDPNAVNGTSGCVGLMQLKPTYFGKDGADLTDPATNIDRGSKELARLLNVKGGDQVAALAAYNLGEYADIDSTVPGQNGLTGREYAAQVLARYQ